MVQPCGKLWERFKEDFTGWMICLAVLVLTVVRSGITYSFGVFVVALVKKYNTPLTEQNWIGTLSFTISLSCAPLSVTLIRWLTYNRYRVTGLLGTLVLSVSCLASSFVHNAEMLFFTHSLLYGVGSSLTYMASSLIIGEYFNKTHRSHVLATSILLCGYPVGSLVFNPINSVIVDKLGWRSAFRISSAVIFFIGTGCCFTFKSKYKASDGVGDGEAEEEEDKDELSRRIMPRISLEDIRNRPEIILWLLASAVTYLGFYVPFLNLEYYMKLKHISLEASGWALFLLSLAECISYISASLLGDWFKGRLIYCNVLAAVALAIICILWPSVDVDFKSILAISFAMGFFLGLTIVYTYAESGEVTLLPIDIAWAYTNMFSGMGILLSPLTSGLVFDVRHNYDDVFYTVGGIYTFLAILFVFIIVLQKVNWRHREFYYNEFTDTAAHEPSAEQEYQNTFRIVRKSISTQSLDSTSTANADAKNEMTGLTNGVANTSYNQGNNIPLEPMQPPSLKINDVYQDEEEKAQDYGGYGY